jgi:hypothetical protein
MCALALCSACLLLIAGAGVAHATTGTEIGGMNLNGYCQSIGDKASTVEVGTTKWVCIRQDNTLTPANLQAACEHEYAQRPILAEEVTPNTPFSWKCFLVAGASRASTTSVICNYVFATFTDTCTATVTGSPAPTGQVTFSSAAGGVFTAGSTCTLAPASPASASCPVQFQPASTSLATVTTTQITASYAGDAANQPSSGVTVFGSAALIERQESSLRESCAAVSGGGAEPTPTGISVTLNVVVPGIVEAEVVGFEGGGSTLPVSLPRLSPIAAVSVAPTGSQCVVACCGGSTGTLPVALPPLHAVRPAAAPARAKPKAKPKLIASLRRHLSQGGKTRLLVPYTAYGRKVERAFVKQLRAYKHHHSRGAKRPVLKLKLKLGYRPG